MTTLRFPSGPLAGQTVTVPEDRSDVFTPGYRFHVESMGDVWPVTEDGTFRTMRGSYRVRGWTASGEVLMEWLGWEIVPEEAAQAS